MEQRQIFHIPLAAGLGLKGDRRAQEPPALDVCLDAEFDDIGGLRTRKPYASIGTNILGGGSITNQRKLVTNGNELLLFTDTAVYSRDVRDTAWALRGTHLAVALTEQTTFATTDDQIDVDRAELNSTVVYTWANGTNVYAAALDKSTGAVIVAPTSLGAGSRPRLVACTTKILAFWSTISAGNSVLVSIAIDPANVATSLVATPTTVVNGGTSYTQCYDVVKISGSDQVVGATRLNPTTSYTVFTVTSAMSVATSTKARTCDGPIAVSCDPTGTTVQIVRASTTNVVGDRLALPGFGDLATAQSIATGVASPINQITACHRAFTQGGQYRCYVFWSAGENTGNSTAFSTSSNWVDTGGSLGTAAAFVEWCGVGSHAFLYNGSIYLWVAFGQTSGMGAGGAMVSATGQFQNSYFLYRDDGFLCAKSVYERGGGLAPSTGRLPGVALTSGTTTFSCVLNERRRIAVGDGTSGGATNSQASSFAMRAPRDITFTFDSNEARRTARIGKTLYIAAGEILQYDGTSIAEVGSHIYPWYIDALQQGPGTMGDGKYGYKSTFRWTNAQGEIDRSTTATVANASINGGGGVSGLSVQTIPLPVTHKTTTNPAIELWRTPVNPPADAPFYLVSSLDPNATTNPNRYLASGILVGFPSTIRDAEGDATATTNQTNPENDGVLENLSPPAAKLIAANETRVFLAAVAGQPDTIWYSKQRGDGEVAAFNDTLTVTVPARGGAITALGFINETLIVFRENAIYALAGDGYDNTGGGVNYGPARPIATDLGAVNQESVAITPEGDLIFKSNRGWYVLDRGWAVHYVGAGIAGYDSETPLAVHVPVGQHQIRVVTSNRVLVWDTLVNQWGEWTISGGLSATIWNDTYHYLTSIDILAEQPDFSGGTNYGMDVELAWWKPAGLVGQFAARWVMPLGEWRSAHSIRIRLARNYQSDGGTSWNYFDDRYKDPAANQGGPVQVRHGPSIQAGIEAIKIRITAANVAKNGTPPTGEALKLTAIGLEVGMAPGLFKQLAQAQKA